MISQYVHGYTIGESTRLQDQASTLTELLHSDTRYPAGSTPRMVYADASRPGLVSGFIKNTFTAMISGVKENALEAGLADG